MKMTKFLSFLYLASILLLASCGKDDDPNPNDFILGTWTVSDITVDVKVGTKTLVQYFVDQGLSQSEAQELADQFTQGFEGGASAEIEFKKDGTYASKDGSSTESGKWEMSADAKTLTIDKGTADESKLTIASHTATTMKLSNQFQESDGGDTFTVKIDMDLKKK